MKNIMGLMQIENVSTDYVEKYFVRFNEKNQKGESMFLVLTKIIDDKNYKKSMPKLWYKAGYIDRVLETYWSIDTEITDTESMCFRKYDPSIKISEDGKRHVINFDWMLEATEKNKIKILTEVYKRFMAAKGKTATQKKIEEVYEYGKKHDIEVVTEIPEGFFIQGCATDPLHAVSIVNMKMSLKAIKDGQFKRMLLIQ